MVQENKKLLTFEEFVKENSYLYNGKSVVIVELANCGGFNEKTGLLAVSNRWGLLPSELAYGGDVETCPALDELLTGHHDMKEIVEDLGLDEEAIRDCSRGTLGVKLTVGFFTKDGAASGKYFRELCVYTDEENNWESEATVMRNAIRGLKSELIPEDSKSLEGLGEDEIEEIRATNAPVRDRLEECRREWEGIVNKYPNPLLYDGAMTFEQLYQDA